METSDSSGGLATPSAPLWLFVDFLALRLETENVELLRRIVDEFLCTPRAFETLQAMIQLAYPFVAILPMERKDVCAREQAQHALLWMRRRAGQADDASCCFREFHTSLQTKIKLANWRCLEQMYDEFCVGNESKLVAFVAAQRQAISIVPVRPIASCKPNMCGLPATTTLQSTQVLMKNEKDCRELRESNSAADGEARALARTEYPSSIPISERLLQNRAVLLAELRAVEAQAPWTMLKALPKMELAFAFSGHEQLETAVKCFWRKHARAVWERNFWYRFRRHDPAFTQEQHDRSRRQERAGVFFEVHVMIPFYMAYGAQFFVDLDARLERVPWWWYRQPIVDIVRFCDREGLETSVAYLLSQSRERFPNTPTGCELHYERHYRDGRSMWSPRDKYQHMTDEIDELKRRATL